MNLAIVKRNSILFFVLFPVFFSACTKIVTTDIGGGLLPGGGVETKDLYMNVATKNAGDSVNHVAISQNFSLGYISNDPIFGKISASINVQLAPTAFPVQFGTYNKDSIRFDSVVLVLGYKGIWGDSFQNLAFRVYQISNDEPFHWDSVYSTAHVFGHTNELTENFQPAVVVPRLLDDSVHPYNEAAVNQVRIRLDGETFGSKLIYGFDTSNAYKTDSIFNQFFRGFQIVPEKTGNSLLRINVLDSNTKLAIYYRYNDGNGNKDTAVKYFKASANVTAAANYVKPDRSGAQVQNYYPSGNSEDSLLFLEAGPGIFTNVQFPSFTGLNKIIIQRAELVMDQVPDLVTNSDLFLTPPNLFLTAYSPDYHWRFATPRSLFVASDSSSISNVAASGSRPIATIDPISGKSHYSYSFDVTQYVQGVVTHGDKPFNFVLFGPGNDFIYASETLNRRIPVSATPINDPAAGRVRLGGGNSISHPMRLHIVYSSIP